MYFQFALFADSLPMESVCCRGWRAVLNWLSQILCFSDVPRESVYLQFALLTDSLPMESVCCRGWRAVLNWLSQNKRPVRVYV